MSIYILLVEGVDAERRWHGPDLGTDVVGYELDWRARGFFPCLAFRTIALGDASRFGLGSLLDRKSVV